ncbi:MAG: BTAD domain-containing putative transcriptional regulator [Caldilineaceae bacterium]
MARLALRLFGGFQAQLEGKLVTGFKTDKARALLAYLAVEAGQPHQRVHLAGLLWPDWPEGLARTYVRQALAHLRQVLGDKKAQFPMLLANRQLIQVNPACDFWLDVAELTKALARLPALDLQHAGPDSVARLEAAVALYRGRLLEGFFLDGCSGFEEWQLLTGEQIQRQVVDALQFLCRWHEAQGDLVKARQYAQRCVEVEPLLDDPHCQLMRLLALIGEPNAALAHYEQYCRQLTEALDTTPPPEAAALAEQIRVGKWGSKMMIGEISPRNPAAAVPLHNLPFQSIPFVGRVDELAIIAERLAQPTCRLLTLVGAGGSGKTRLVIEAAAAGLKNFSQGAYFVSLAAVAAPDLVVSAIADALKFRFYAGESPKVQLFNYLREKQMLLVIDNFEHLLDAAELLTEILTNTTGVKLLVTSRERLNVQEEWLLPLDGLDFPETALATVNIDHYSALLLFLRCAQKVQPFFTPSLADKHAMVRICRLVEGMPLAIELAAAWTRTLSCAEIAQAISQSLDFLTTSLRNVPARQRSLRATFDHSWRLLSVQEQFVLRRLAVFAGGFTSEAVTAVCASGRGEGVPNLPILRALVDKSLVGLLPGERYHLHELLRQYAGEKLAEAGETQQTYKRHLEYFLQLAEVADEEIKGAQQKAWLERLEAEHDNLRAALAWCQTEAGEGRTGLRLTGALSWFWHLRGYAREGRRWIEGLLAHSTGQDPAGLPARAKAQWGAGLLALVEGDLIAAKLHLEESIALGRALEELSLVGYALAALGRVLLDGGDRVAAHTLATESVALFRQSGDRWGLAMASNYLGWALCAVGDDLLASAYFEESRSIFQRLGDKWGIALALDGMAEIARAQNDYRRETALMAESLAINREIGDKHSIAYLLSALGDQMLRQGDLVQAAQHHHNALALFRELGVQRGIGVALHNLADVAVCQGNRGQAAVYIHESLMLFQKLGNQEWCILCLITLAQLAAAAGRLVRAAQLLGVIEAQLERLGTRLWPLDRANYEQTVTTVRTSLEQSAFTQALATGRAMSLEQAIAFALSS